MNKSKLYPKIKMPTLEDNIKAQQFLYPNYVGVYSDEQRREINGLARELMLKRETKH